MFELNKLFATNYKQKKKKKIHDKFHACWECKIKSKLEQTKFKENTDYYLI